MIQIDKIDIILRWRGVLQYLAYIDFFSEFMFCLCFQFRISNLYFVYDLKTILFMYMNAANNFTVHCLVIEIWR
jgi:hypothetical protein